MHHSMDDISELISDHDDDINDHHDDTNEINDEDEEAIIDEATEEEIATMKLL